jgi:hypothetical protein
MSLSLYHSLRMQLSALEHITTSDRYSYAILTRHAKHQCVHHGVLTRGQTLSLELLSDPILPLNMSLTVNHYVPQYYQAIMTTLASSRICNDDIKHLAPMSVCTTC